MTTVQQGEIKGRATDLRVWKPPLSAMRKSFVCHSCLKEAELWVGMFLGDSLTICLCQKCAVILENDLRFIECYAARSLDYAHHRTPADRDVDVTVEVYGGVADVTEAPRFLNVKIIDHDNKGR